MDIVGGCIIVTDAIASVVMSVELPARSLVMPPSWRATDVKDFAERVLSIAGSGIGRPFLVTTDLVVLHRHEDAAACRMLNLPAVPVEILDMDEMLASGSSVTFLPSEAVAVGRLLEESLRPLAEVRQREGRARGAAHRSVPPEERPTSVASRASVRELTAAALGMSSSSYARVRDVVLAAEAEPERFGDLVVELDRSNNVSGTHAELRRRQNPVETEDEVLAPPKKAIGSLFKISQGRDPAVVIQNTVYALLAAAETFDQLDVSPISSEIALDWVADLRTVAKSLSKFRSRLADIAKEDG